MAFIVSLLLVLFLGQCNAVPKSIYLLAGQSNMSGRGGVGNRAFWDRVVPPECSPTPSVFRFAANMTWEEAQEPLHIDIDRHQTCGVGPGMPFATSLLQAGFNETIGLVPCAIGGTALSLWGKGRPLYIRLVERAFASTRNGGVIQGLLWYQGEEDGRYRETALSYGTRFQQFINDIRADLLSPDLPVILVALDTTAGYAPEVREAQLGLRMHNVKCVDALGLPLESDHIHLTTEAQVTLGKKMAMAFLSLQ